VISRAVAEYSAKAWEITRRCGIHKGDSNFSRQLFTSPYQPISVQSDDHNLDHRAKGIERRKKFARKTAHPDYEWSRHTQAIEEAKAAGFDPILALR
jgi:hypothetical protein